MSSNLFIQFHEKQCGSADDPVGTGWENILTESLCFYLNCDQEALVKLCRLVLGNDFEPPVEVRTQLPTHEGQHDLVISLCSQRLLIFEHKVDASLGPRQIERYLSGKDSHCRSVFVTLFAKRSHDLSSEVLGNPCYKRPTNGAHFHWQDLYATIPGSGNEPFGLPALRRFFRDYLGLLGFDPSSPPRGRRTSRRSELYAWLQIGAKVRGMFGGFQEMTWEVKAKTETQAHLAATGFADIWVKLGEITASSLVN